MALRLGLFLAVPSRQPLIVLYCLSASDSEDPRSFKSMWLDSFLQPVWCVPLSFSLGRNSTKLDSSPANHDLTEAVFSLGSLETYADIELPMMLIQGLFTLLETFGSCNEISTSISAIASK